MYGARVSDKRSAVRLGIAIPTYNEARNIRELIERIKIVAREAHLFCSVLIIDDNSPDATGTIANQLTKTERGKSFSIKVLHRSKKQGLGSAYVAGFKNFLAEDVTHILQMDADLSHNPKYIPTLVHTALDKQADLVIGSRYVSGGSTPDWKPLRLLLSYGGNLYARLWLGKNIRDYTGGFNLYSSKLLKKIDFDSLQSSGYEFQVELKYRTLIRKARVFEIPIVFLDRTNGRSKIPRRTIFTSLWLIPLIRFRNTS